MKNDKSKAMRITGKTSHPRNLTELYEYFEKRSGYTSKNAEISPREFGVALASQLLNKIDKEIVVHK
jgi:hypothetical protein